MIPWPPYIYMRRCGHAMESVFKEIGCIWDCIRGGRKVLTFANHLEGLIIFMVILCIH